MRCTRSNPCPRPSTGGASAGAEGLHSAPEFIRRVRDSAACTTHPYSWLEQPRERRRTIMKVKDLHTSDVRACSPDTNLAAAAQIMWDCDCGIVPVVEDQKVVGVITDRDICIAATTRSAAPAAIAVRHVMSTGKVHSCLPDDDVRTVLATMGTHRVRRLPVVDRQNRLVGIISLSDLVRRADYRTGADVPGAEFMEALQSIASHK